MAKHLPSLHPSFTLQPFLLNDDEWGANVNLTQPPKTEDFSLDMHMLYSSNISLDPSIIMAVMHIVANNSDGRHSASYTTFAP